MPTLFSHAIFATFIGRALTRVRVPVRFWVFTALCAIAPDADVAGFAFGVRYGSLFGHRGITHSLLFALIVGAAVGVFVKARPGAPQQQLGTSHNLQTGIGIGFRF